MFGLLVLAIFAADPAPTGQKDTVVVTAQSLSSTERNLADCLARKCTPREDIDASLAHGENLFIAGEYAEARRVLRKSRSRNMRFAATLPVEVADLNRAYGRISAFDGYSDNSRLAQIESLEALKAGLDRDDARVLLQRLMIADEYLRAGRLTAADDVFSTVEKQAVAAGLPRVQGLTMLKQAGVYATIANVLPEYRATARHRLNRLMKTTDPELAPFRDAANTLQAQIAGERKDEKALNAIIAAMDRSNDTAPRLVYAPVIDLQRDAPSLSSVVIQRGDDQPQFIDVNFEIDRDGRVQDVDIVRKTDTVEGYWPELVREAVAGRRYVPIGPKVKPSQLLRTERFSLVFNVATLTGSRMPSRSPRGRIISLDLTADSKPADANPVTPPVSDPAD